MEKGKIYITKGLPASGKSTWAKAKALEQKNIVIVNRDSIRTMLRGEYKNFPFNSSMEDLVTKIEKGAIYAAVKSGYDLIIDATNFRISTNPIADLASLYDYEIQIIDFTNVPLEECIRRDAEREISVGEAVIRRMYDKYLKK